MADKTHMRDATPPADVLMQGGDTGAQIQAALTTLTTAIEAQGAQTQAALTTLTNAVGTLATALATRREAGVGRAGAGNARPAGPASETAMRAAQAAGGTA